MSREIPPYIPARGSARAIPSAPLSPSSDVPKKCTHLDGCDHCRHTILPREVDADHYDKLNMTELDIETRLLKLEDNQVRIRFDFSQFRDDMTSSIRSLHVSLNEIKTTSNSLENIMRESSTLLQASIDKLHQRLLENSDHLGKQILDVRRDIISKKTLPSVKNK